VRSTGIAPLPSDKPRFRLDDVLDNIDRIRRYTENYTFDRFAADLKCQDAVERCLLRISEAARKLEGIVDTLAPDQPWSDVRAVGNVLRHEYDAVNPAVIWRIVEHDLEPLRAAVERAMTILQSKDVEK
jgi:uncharacterized protein with HEPN domain